ncbi:hypothetical protein [Pandoraea terrigena]|nr:hypothetical protein [Pandoraea terrigena]
MKMFTVKTTRVAIVCLVTASFTITAQAEITVIGSIPVGVSDALLSSTRAANLQQSIVAFAPGTGAGAVAPLHATVTTANNVRLWDEVIPPTPLPKPTQASMSLPDAPRMIAVVSQIPHASLPALTAGFRPAQLSLNLGVGRIQSSQSR